jgi:hypothetical protein
LVAPAGCTTASRGVVATDGGAADGAALEPDSGADAAGDASDDASGGGFDASSNCGSPGLPCCEHACTAGCCDGPTQLCAVTCGVTGSGDD